jgi:hypothetical protein
MSPLPSVSKNMESKNQRKKQVESRALVSCSAFSSILKMEATCSSEMSLCFKRTTQFCTPENSSLCKTFLTRYRSNYQQHSQIRRYVSFRTYESSSSLKTVNGVSVTHRLACCDLWQVYFQGLGIEWYSTCFVAPEDGTYEPKPVALDSDSRCSKKLICW